jgi:hypothetical protein
MQNKHRESLVELTESEDRLMALNTERLRLVAEQDASRTRIHELDASIAGFDERLQALETKQKIASASLIALQTSGLDIEMNALFATAHVMLTKVSSALFQGAVTAAPGVDRDLLARACSIPFKFYVFVPPHPVEPLNHAIDLRSAVPVSDSASSSVSSSSASAALPSAQRRT